MANDTVNVASPSPSMAKMLSYARKALALVWQTDRTQTLLLLGTSFLISLLPAVQYWIVSLLINTAAYAGDSQKFALVPLIVWLICLYVGQTLLQNVQIASQVVLQLRLTQDIRMQINEHAQALDISYFEDADFHDRLRRASTDAIFRPSAMLVQLTTIGTNVITMVSLFVIVIHASWALAVAVVLSSLPQLFYQLATSRKIFDITNRYTASMREISYYTYLLTGIEAVKEIKLFGLAALFLERCQTHFERFFKEEKNLRWKRTWGNTAGALFSGIIVGGALLLVMQGGSVLNLTGGDIYLYIQATLDMRSRIQSVLMSFADFYESLLFVSTLFEFLSSQSKLPRPTHPVKVPACQQQGITFRQVSFTYPGTKSPALHKLDLHISPGESLAVVGENGAGKTTLIKLLTRLYDPTEGCITVEGIDLRQFDADEWRQQIGVLFQDFVKYQIMARDNIGLGQVDYINDIARIQSAARAAGIDDLLSALPSGYNTLLGRMFEQGHELSGGEWQKIALARALMRRSPIVILDEPSAALDAQSERDFFERFKNLTAGRTAVFISHRFSTVRQADRIIVLNEGQIVEEGNHAELMCRGGLYAQMFRLQSEMYT